MIGAIKILFVYFTIKYFSIAKEKEALIVFGTIGIIECLSYLFAFYGLIEEKKRYLIVTITCQVCHFLLMTTILIVLFVGNYMHTLSIHFRNIDNGVGAND